MISTILIACIVILAVGVVVGSLWLWSEEPAMGIGALVLGALIVGISSFGLANAMHVNHVTCTVTDKDRTKGDGSSDARIYTEECGTLSVSDSLLEGHWSSSDTYASIDVGQAYEFKTRGWRIPFLSMFPNIVKVNPDVEAR